jgi:hypothetical protein
MSLILSGTNGLSDVDGSAATPAIRGTDTNTGIFFPAADTIAFAEGGAEAARFDASGNFLVGTTNTAAGKLSVLGRMGAFNTTGANDSLIQLWNNGTTSNIASTYSSTGAYTPLTFLTSDVERLRLPTGGGVQAVTTISVGNATPSSSGAGITFPATQDASSNANTLDDYEEGTFTPTLTAATTAPSSVSYAYQVGKYTKVGRLVTVNVDLQINSRSGGSGSARIGNLPFTNSASDSFIGNGYLGQVNWGSGKTALYFAVVASNTLVNIGSMGTGIDPSGIAITEFNDTNDYISFCVTYSV